MKAKAILTTAFGLACLGIVFLTARAFAQQANDKPTTEASKQATQAKENETTNEVESVNQRSFWMEQKLRLSKGVLEGLANGDFEAIGKNAEIMHGLNRVETFVRRRTEGYRDQLRQFNIANKALLRASQTENLDGATLAFNQLTISCVNCHKHMREGEEPLGETNK